jgi:excinuclease ABC subunit C
MFGLAKRNEEIYLPGEENPIVLDSAARAAPGAARARRGAPLRHHAPRARRGKAGVASELETIPGIGQTRKIALLRHFKRLPAILAASEEELAAVDGMNLSAAKAVAEYAKNREQTTLRP